MANSKGTSVVFFRTRWQEDPGTEEAFRKELSDEAREFYDSVLPIAWVPDQIVSEIEQKAAAVLFPDSRDGLQQVGRLQAQHDLRGIYRVLLRIITIPMLIKKAASLWSTYHDAGTADVADLNDKTGTFLVRKHPDLPSTIREVTTGYILGAVELTRAQNVRVVLNEADPNRWAWVVTWG
jgi:hypothetical protein